MHQRKFNYVSLFRETSIQLSCYFRTNIAIYIEWNLINKFFYRTSSSQWLRLLKDLIITPICTIFLYVKWCSRFWFWTVFEKILLITWDANYTNITHKNFAKPCRKQLYIVIFVNFILNIIIAVNKMSQTILIPNSFLFLIKKLPFIIFPWGRPKIIFLYFISFSLSI